MSSPHTSVSLINSVWLEILFLREEFSNEPYDTSLLNLQKSIFYVKSCPGLVLRIPISLGIDMIRKDIQVVGVNGTIRIDIAVEIILG